MPSRTGTASQVDASAGNGSTSVTVPADATMAVAFWSHWDGNAGETLSGLTLGGNAFTTQSQLAEGATADESGVGVAVLTSLPGTGSQTLAWTWSAGGARTEGGEIVVVWIKGHNTSTPVRAAGVDAATVSNNVAVTISSETTDLLLAFAEDFSDTNPALDGTVFINNAVVNSHSYDVSEVTPSAGSTTVNMTSERYSAMAAISLPVAAAGGSSSFRRTNTELGTRKGSRQAA